MSGLVEGQLRRHISKLYVPDDSALGGIVHPLLFQRATNVVGNSRQLGSCSGIRESRNHDE